VTDLLSNADRPQILQHPVDTSIEVGGIALFSVKAYYPLPLDYQWYYDSENDFTETIEGN
jgi:hypothetical protein